MKVVKVPSSQGGLKKSEGSEKAPDKILEKAKDIFLSEEGLVPMFEVDKVDIVMNNLEQTNQNIYDKAKQVLAKEHAIFLGGDHSITFQIMKAFAELNEDAGMIVLDAHPDCQEHTNIPTHEDYLRRLIEEGIVKKENLVIVGVRNMHKNSADFLKKNRVKVFGAKEISFEGLKEVCDAVMTVANRFSALYISIDIDIVDPAFAPGTGYNEPGGLTSRELLYMIHRFKMLKKLKAVDIVEISPDKDSKDYMTCRLGAKILAELS